MASKAMRAIFGFYLPVLLLAVPMLFPFYWLVTSALKTPREVFTFPPTWYPHEPTADGFREVFSGGGFTLSLWNSLLVAITVTILAILLGLCGGYALARLHFRLRHVAGVTLLMTQLFPAAAILIPLFLFWSRAGLHASYTALICTYLAQAVPITTWLLKGYLETIPKEMEEQAWIDGASRGRAFVSIVLPLAWPAIASTAMMSFINAWNEYLYALTLAGTSPARKTLPVALVDFIGQHGVEWHKLMAAATVATIPSVALFFAAQRFFVRGLTAGAVKG